MNRKEGEQVGEGKGKGRGGKKWLVKGQAAGWQRGGGGVQHGLGGRAEQDGGREREEGKVVGMDGAEGKGATTRHGSCDWRQTEYGGRRGRRGSEMRQVRGKKAGLSDSSAGSEVASGGASKAGEGTWCQSSGKKGR